jgi:hypothetical protein
MKIELIISHEESLKALSQLSLSDAQLAWDLSDSLELVGKATQKFHEKRNELIKKYGKPEKDNPEQFNITDLKSFNAEIQKLAAVEVDISWPELKLENLNGEAVKPAQILAWRELGIIKK